MRRNILSIFGTRPEAIKMAPIVKALEADPRFDSHVLPDRPAHADAGRRGKMFEILVWRDLNVMKHRQTLPYLTAALATQISDALAELQPDMVLVHGDTTTTFMGALAATYAKIPVSHVEAGLRSHQKFQPFPRGSEPHADGSGFRPLLRAHSRRPDRIFCMQVSTPAEIDVAQTRSWTPYT